MLDFGGEFDDRGRSVEQVDGSGGVVLDEPLAIRGRDGSVHEAKADQDLCPGAGLSGAPGAGARVAAWDVSLLWWGGGPAACRATASN
ncbi:hypothetical protein [Streptomyces sp. NPDC093589]|uniref:hypothetical protein n=1 Tax=Streptomyces sp. NPDC093589 TaxID=3366043 RepID=UPI00382DB91C